jgi:ABC-type molybdenum transport system ATPase subunit/photorepair protein PhrA
MSLVISTASVRHPALAASPELLILDDRTLGLDALARRALSRRGSGRSVPAR